MMAPDAAYWRMRSNQCREAARGAASDALRARMLRFAEDYDVLACEMDAVGTAGK